MDVKSTTMVGNQSKIQSPAEMGNIYIVLRGGIARINYGFTKNTRILGVKIRMNVMFAVGSLTLAVLRRWKTQSPK